MSRRSYDALLARAGDEEAEDRMTVLLANEAREADRLPADVSALVLKGYSFDDAVERAMIERGAKKC